MRRFLALAVALAAFASPAWAGVQAIYRPVGPNRGSGTLRIEVADNGDLRIENKRWPHHYLLIGEDFYVVEQRAKGPKVQRLVDQWAGYGKAASLSAQSHGWSDWTVSAPSFTTNDISIQKGERVRVNDRWGISIGLTGVEWGDELFDDFVISDDPALGPIGQGLKRLMATLAKVAEVGKGGPKAEQEARLMAFARIYAMGTPLHGPIFNAFSDEYMSGTYRLSKVQKVVTDPRRFALPAEPMAFDEATEERQGAEQRLVSDR